MPMDYNLLRVKAEKQQEALTKTGHTRIGYAHVHLPSPTSGGDEHQYFDLRGLSRHTTKFRNWAKKEFANRKYAIYIP